MGFKAGNAYVAVFIRQGHQEDGTRLSTNHERTQFCRGSVEYLPT